MADIGASNWNEVDGSNSSAAPDGAPEGMQPGGVNDTIRAVMGAVKRFFNWQSTKLTGGTGTAYTLGYGVGPGALVDGMTHLVQFHVGNGVAATLNVNALGAIPLHYYAAGAWRVAPPGLFDANETFRLPYHASSGAYRLVDLRNRTGTIEAFAGAAPAPAGTLLCYGQAISRTTYAGLFAVIGTAYGAGDGSTTFNVPDLRGLVVAGLDNMGGASANHLNAILASTTLGAIGGQQTESAAISGSFSGGGSGSGIGTAVGSMLSDESNNNSGGQAGASGDFPSWVHKHNVNINIPVTVGVSVTVSGGISGSTSGVTNVQPTMVMNQLIRI